jgi:hypothetical protein
MPTRFSFEGALSNAFSAAHVRSFPWLFAAAFALVFTVYGAIMAYLAGDAFLSVANGLEALTEADFDESDPRGMVTMMFGMLAPLVPWSIAASVGAWALWAMFEASSQRRYIRDERFSLRFGGDELRMMVVGLFWSLFYLACFGLPMLSIFSGMMGILDMIASDLSEDELARRIVPVVFGGMGFMLLALPVYVFLATRLAPCFAMTIKDRRIVFLDAWNVSRGRFWPILGAFVILSIGGSVVASVIGQALQFGVMMPVLGRIEDAESIEDFVRVFQSPAFLVPMGIYALVRLFLSGLLQHVTGAPAAFAARHDPRGGVDDAARMAVFD